MAPNDLIQPGMIFQVIPMPKPTPVKDTGIPPRSISNYGYTVDEIDFTPNYYTAYFMASDGCVGRYDKKNHMIGFDILQENGKVYYRINQVGFYPIEIKVEIIGSV